MSTATRGDGQTHWTAEEVVHGAIAMSPTSGRTIVVEVYKHEEGKHSVHWKPVLAFCSVIRTRYGKRMSVVDQRHPRVAADHAGMIEAGWTCHEASEIEVLPLVQDREYGLFPIDARLDCDNMLKRVVAPCDWPSEQDQENVIRIGKAIIAGTYDQGGWVDFEEPS